MSDALFNSDQQQQIDDAATSVHHWRGKKLYPFSFERECAYERLGLDGESNLESCAAIVFLCTLGDEIAENKTTGIDIIESARGKDGIRAFRQRMNAWADSQGITGNNAEGIEVIRVGLGIWRETKVSRFKPEGGSAPNV